MIGITLGTHRVIDPSCIPAMLRRFDRGRYWLDADVREYTSRSRHLRMGRLM
jgi:hypothetical protein